jgi:hypothetical protein
MGFTGGDEAPSARPSTSPKSNSTRRGSSNKSVILDKTKEIVELLDEYLEDKAVSKSTNPHNKDSSCSLSTWMTNSSPVTHASCWTISRQTSTNFSNVPMADQYQRQASTAVPLGHAEPTHSLTQDMVPMEPPLVSERRSCGFESWAKMETTRFFKPTRILAAVS